MSTTTVTLQLDTESAHIYENASAEGQEKLRLLLSLWLREFGASDKSLQRIMDEISTHAQARGLTPEILDTLLHAR